MTRTLRKPNEWEMRRMAEEEKRRAGRGRADEKSDDKVREGPR